MTKKSTKKLSSQTQLELAPLESVEPISSTKPSRPATNLMKIVAEKTGDKKRMAKAFSPEEIEEILARRDAGEALESPEYQAIREEYRAIKRHAKELEKGNQSRLIVVPSIVTREGFYKVFDFSALYYVYNLADRMGRKAKIMNDNDRYSKMIHSASIVDIEKFIEQFKRLEDSNKIEKTEDGIYIFTLKKPLTDDEVGQLRLVEETRRDKLHNIMKPKSMDPAVFQAILMVVRQVAPKIRKLEKHNYRAIGEGMLEDLNLLLSTYYSFANGLMEKRLAGDKILITVDRLFAGLTILSETRVWDFSASIVVGENINEIRRLVVRDFKK